MDAVNKIVPEFTADRILKGLCSVRFTMQVASGFEQSVEISRVPDFIFSWLQAHFLVYHNQPFSSVTLLADPIQL